MGSQNYMVGGHTSSEVAVDCAGDVSFAISAGDMEEKRKQAVDWKFVERRMGQLGKLKKMKSDGQNKEWK
jgi:hypothetical protein